MLAQYIGYDMMLLLKSLIDIQTSFGHIFIQFQFNGFASLWIKSQIDAKLSFILKTLPAYDVEL